MVMTVLPPRGPLFGFTADSVGGDQWVKPFARFAVPLAVVADTVFAPAAPAGVTAVIVVGLVTTTEVAATPPTVTVAGTPPS